MKVVVTISEQLVKAAQRGNENAFAELLKPMENKLYAMAFSTVGNRHDAEDAWQNAVLKAWQQIRSLRNPLFFRSWITRILLNEATAILRKRARNPIPSVDLPEETTHQPDVEQFLVVQKMLQLLPKEQRQALILRFWADMPLAEIALTLDVPLSTAKTRLYQGIKLLRARMEKEGMTNGR